MMMKRPLLFLSCLLPSLAQALAPTPPPALPAPVASFGAAATPEGTVYIYGGHAGVRHRYNKEEVSGELHRWSPGGQSWEKLPASEPAQGASLVALPDQLLRIGGMAARNAKGQTQDLWSSQTAARFSPQTQQWTPLPDLPQRRSSHDSVAIGSTLYVIGGWALGGGKSSDPEATWHSTYLTLDLANPQATWQSHPQPFARRAAAVMALGTRIYVIGGMDEGDEVTSKVSVLDTHRGQWSTGPELPADKLGGFGFSSVTHEGRLFASGAPGLLLELQGDNWQPIAQLAHPRFFHRLVPGGKGRLIALGGESRSGEKAPTEVISLPSADTKPAQHPHPARTEAAAPSAPKTTLPPSPAPSWPAQVPSAEADWPSYQGPRGNSTTPEVGFLTDWPADGPPVAWREQVGLGLASMAVVGQQVFATGNDGQDHDILYCLDLKSGITLWKHSHSVRTKSHDMSIVPFGPASTPNVSDGKVYTLSREGHLLCLDAAKGSLLWQRHLITDLGGKRPVYGYSSSVSIHGHQLFLDIGGQGKSTTCLNSSTGEVLWQTGDGEAGYSTPYLTQHSGQSVLVAFKGEALELRQPTDGKLLASHPTTTRDYCNCATPLRAGDSFFISHTGNMGARLLDWKPDGLLTERWTERDFGLLFHSGLPWGNHVLAFNDALRGGNDLRLLDLANGSTRWQSKDIAKGTGLLTDDGHAILLTNQGELHLTKITAQGIEILAKVQALPAKCWVQPVLSHRHLICRNNQGDLICYQL